MDNDILSHCELDVIEAEIEDLEAITAKIINCKQQIDAAILAFSPMEVPASPRSPVTPAPLAVTSVKPQLPKLLLPKFKGDVKNWMAFLDSFKSAVHNNGDVPKVDKFNYLNSLLEGPAFRTIQGLTLTESNYDAAIEILQERFGNPQ